MSDYISRQAAEDAMTQSVCGDTWEVEKAMEAVRQLPAEDVVPYSIASDGTVTITVPKGTYKKFNRVLVEEDGTHWGGLFYKD